MKNSSLKLLSLVLCLLMLFSLAGCYSHKGSADEAYGTQTTYATYNSAANGSYAYKEAAVAGGDFGGFSAMADIAYEEAVMASPREEPAAQASGEASAAEASDLNPEKIIYSADATIESTEFDSTVAALEAMIQECGGWVESSSVNGANYSSISGGRKVNRSASYTLRIPNDKFAGIMNSLSSLGNVPYSHVYTENVTSQYYDTQARLTTYQAQEQRLIELLDVAETVSDVIEIENELAEVRYRIESLQTSLRGWDRRVSWSTIYLTVNEVTEYTPEKKVTYGERLSRAVSNGLESLGDAFVDFVEILPELLFTLLIAALVLIVFIRLIRRAIKSKGIARRGRKAKKTTDAAVEQPAADRTEK